MKVLILDLRMHLWVALALQSRLVLTLFLSTASFALVLPQAQAAESIQEPIQESIQQTSPGTLQQIPAGASLHKIQEAQALYQQAMELAEEKRYNQAIDVAGRSLQLRQEVWGELHKEVLDSLLLMAELNRVTRKHSRADELLSQALPMSRQIWGEKSPVAASILYSLGVLQLQQGNVEAAEAKLLESLEIRREVLSPDSPSLVSTLYFVGVMYAEKSSYTQAENILEEALELAEKHLDSDEESQVASISVMLRRVRRLMQHHPIIASAFI